VDSRPAGFSSKWLGDILRGQCGFTGAIFSDDLSMEAARLIDGEKVSYTQAAVTALNAGCDMVLLCNQSVDGGEAVDELINGMVEEQVKSNWYPCEASDLRRLALLPATSAPEWDALMVQPAYMQSLSLMP
jgi:beta-N-acetylhexosaminidase